MNFKKCIQQKYGDVKRTVAKVGVGRGMNRQSTEDF